MSEKEYSDYIEDIRRSITLIEEFTADMDFGAFAEDYKTQYAVVRCFEIMGEAAKRIPDKIRLGYPLIPWKIMAGMRDRMIHGYDVIDVAILWKTVKQDIPSLKISIRDVTL